MQGSAPKLHRGSTEEGGGGSRGVLVHLDSLEDHPLKLERYRED